MRSLEARIAALEALRPAPNMRFVANYGPDGTLVPMRRGEMWGKHIALMPEPSATVGEWLSRYVGSDWQAHEATMRRAEEHLKNHFRCGTGATLAERR